jgi:hypothetical protein
MLSSNRFALCALPGRKGSGGNVRIQADQPRRYRESLTPLVVLDGQQKVKLKCALHRLSHAVLRKNCPFGQGVGAYLLYRG